MITFTKTSNIFELEEILQLQQRNFPKQLSGTEIKTEGFVTVEHDLEILSKMHDLHLHIIAKDNDKLVGYTLAMSTSFKNEIPVLIPIFNELSKCDIDANFIVMGQVCVAKQYKGKGVFRGLYDTMAAAFLVGLQVLLLNTRSLKAHETIGFSDFCIYKAEEKLWKVVSLEI